MTSHRTGVAVVSGLALLAALAAPGDRASAGTFDGSKPFLCAVTTIMECDASGQCERGTPEVAGAPTFIRIDVGTLTIAAGAKRSALRTNARINGRLILQGGENGRGWSATIDEDSGQLSAAVVDNDYTFSLFGACTIP